jgi:surface protein
MHLHFNQDISSWDVADVTNMSYMFNGLVTAFNQNISTWNTGSVTDMSFMFQGATAFNQNISSGTQAVSRRWQVCSRVPRPLIKISVDGIRVLQQIWIAMFSGATAFNQDIGGWDVDLVTDFSAMLNNSGLSSANYDNLLIGWEAQSLQSGRTLWAANIEYCNATTERSNIIGSYSWTINDNGQDPSVSASTIYHKRQDR